jgi:hypothetical protein
MHSFKILSDGFLDMKRYARADRTYFAPCLALVLLLSSVSLLFLSTQRDAVGKNVTPVKWSPL